MFAMIVASVFVSFVTPPIFSVKLKLILAPTQPLSAPFRNTPVQLSSYMVPAKNHLSLTSNMSNIA